MKVASQGRVVKVGDIVRMMKLFNLNCHLLLLQVNSDCFYLMNTNLVIITKLLSVNIIKQL